MKFYLFANGELVGWTELPHGDPPMGVVTGPFYPNKNYQKIQAVIQERHLFDGMPGEMNEVKLDEIALKITALHLTVKTEDGEDLDPLDVAITDLAAESAGEEEWGDFYPYELTVLGLHHETFDKYWKYLRGIYRMQFAEDFETLLTELETTSDAFWNVSRENAQFLSLLIKATGAKRVLEVGTSNGYSTLWFARALVDAKAPNAEVVAIEFDAGRAALARENYRRAGLSDIITLHEGDARQVISTLSGPFDFVFLDAEKPQYADYLRAVLPLVRPNGLIIGDDTVSLRDKMPDYVALAFSHPELESVDVPIDDGVIISRKKG